MKCKPSGTIELDPSHPLYSNIKAVIVIEDDGTVREIISGKTGSSVTPVQGNDCCTGSTVQVDVNMEVELDVLDLANNSEFSHVFYGDLDRPEIGTDSDLLTVTDHATDMTRSYSCLFRNSQRQVDKVRNALRGGWSGTLIDQDDLVHENGDYGICGTGVAIDNGGNFDSNIFDSGDPIGTDTDGLHQVNDANNGSNTYIHLKPCRGETETPVVYYGMILDKKLSEQEWEDLDNDPWGIFNGELVYDRSISPGIGRGVAVGIG